MRQVIATDKAPEAIGPYSQAIKAGGFIFISGQIPLHPSDGLVIAGDIAMQTAQAIENLKAILEAGGSSMRQVVRTTVYLTDMDNFQKFNECYQRYFSANPPARSTVEVSRLPKDVLIEIDAIALDIS